MEVAKRVAKKEWAKIKELPPPPQNEKKEKKRNQQMDNSFGQDDDMLSKSFVQLNQTIISHKEPDNSDSLIVPDQSSLDLIEEKSQIQVIPEEIKEDVIDTPKEEKQA